MKLKRSIDKNKNSKSIFLFWQFLSKNTNGKAVTKKNKQINDILQIYYVLTKLFKI